MEFADIVLIVIYLAFAIAFGSVVWSIYRRNRKGAGRQSIQNGIHVRRLNLIVWISIAIVFAITAIFCDLADIMIFTLAFALLAAIVAIAWAMIKSKMA